MSEKHLTEAAWKAVISKHKLKDAGFGKALAAYGKCGEQDFKGRLAALDDIEKEAATTKKDKAVKDCDDALAFLKDVEAEVAKARKAVAVAQKEAEESEDEDEEGGADPGAVKKRMLSLLGQVKTKAPEDNQLQFMACIAKGGSAVLLARTAGSALKKTLLEILPPTATGPKYLTGECRWEENAHTFVLEKVPGGLSKKLQRALLSETGVKHRVRVRTLDGSFIADAETEAEQELPEDETESNGATPPPVTDDAKAAWLELKARLAPAIKTALAENPAQKDSVLRQLATATNHEKSSQYVEALATGRALLASLTTPQPPPTTADPAMAAVQGAIAKVLPKIKDMIAAQPQRKNELLRPLALVQAQIKAGNAEAAKEQFRMLVGVISASPKQPMELEKALTGWTTARTQVITTLKALETAIRGLNDPDGDDAIILCRAISANLTVRPETPQQVAELERYITTDNIIDDAETPNGVGILVNIRTPLLSALGDVKASLAAAA